MYLLDNVLLKNEFFELQPQGDRDHTKDFTNTIQSLPEKADTSFELSQDIKVMIRDIREKFIVARPLISDNYVACTDKSLEGIEDILCMVSLQLGVVFFSFSFYLSFFFSLAFVTVNTFQSYGDRANAFCCFTNQYYGIRKTMICIPQKPHFYIAKLGYTGVHIFF